MEIKGLNNAGRVWTVKVEYPDALDPTLNRMLRFVAKAMDNEALAFEGEDASTQNREKPF